MFISSFDDVFEILLGIEGNFSNDPKDPGNWTGGASGQGTLKGSKFGISAKQYPNLDIVNLTKDQCKSLAKNDYWDRYQCDQFDARIAYQVFDAAYNGGHPVQWLQQAAGCAVDGSIGAVTIAAVRASSVPAICLSFNASRLVYMAGLNNWDANSEGWARRIAKCMLIGMP